MSIKERMSVRTESEPEIKTDLFSIIDDDFGQISFMFFIPQCQERNELVNIIQKHGGIIVDEPGCSIYQLKPRSLSMDRIDPRIFTENIVYDADWVYDCIKQQNLISKKEYIIKDFIGQRRINKKGPPFSIIECLRMYDAIEIRGHHESGINRSFWKNVANTGFFPGRSPESLLNRWKSSLSKMTRKEYARKAFQNKEPFSNSLKAIPFLYSNKKNKKQLYDYDNEEQQQKGGRRKSLNQNGNIGQRNFRQDDDDDDDGEGIYCNDNNYEQNIHQPQQQQAGQDQEEQVESVQIDNYNTNQNQEVFQEQKHEQQIQERQNQNSNKNDSEDPFIHSQSNQPTARTYTKPKPGFKNYREIYIQRNEVHSHQESNIFKKPNRSNIRKSDPIQSQQSIYSLSALNDIILPKKAVSTKKKQVHQPQIKKKKFDGPKYFQFREDQENLLDQAEEYVKGFIGIEQNQKIQQNQGEEEQKQSKKFLQSTKQQICCQWIPDFEDKLIEKNSLLNLCQQFKDNSLIIRKTQIQKIKKNSGNLMVVVNENGKRSISNHQDQDQDILPDLDQYADNDDVDVDDDDDNYDDEQRYKFTTPPTTLLIDHKNEKQISQQIDKLEWKYKKVLDYQDQIFDILHDHNGNFEEAIDVLESRRRNRKPQIENVEQNFVIENDNDDDDDYNDDAKNEDDQNMSDSKNKIQDSKQVYDDDSQDDEIQWTQLEDLVLRSSVEGNEAYEFLKKKFGSKSIMKRRKYLGLI